MPAFAVPALFVLLWSTGFLGARLGSPHAEPFHFLAWRFAIVAALLLPVAWISRAPWPSSRREAGGMALAGLLSHGACLGGVFNAVHAGMPLGLVAMIGGLQPVITALAARWLFGERLRPTQWGGVALGFLGVILVASGKVGVGRVTPFGLAGSIIGVLGITSGTLVQKKFGGGDFRTVGVIQYVAAFLAMLVGALLFESGPVHWTPEFIGAMAWLIFVNSIIAIALLYVMVARSSLARVTSLFYLTPSVTAVMAWGLFREPITALMAAGIAVSSVGVFLTVRPAPETVAPEQGE